MLHFPLQLSCVPSTFKFTYQLFIVVFVEGLYSVVQAILELSVILLPQLLHAEIINMCHQLIML